MSFTDRLMLWFHVAFVIFTIGPVTIAVMSTPRYIRTRNVAVLRYLLRLTRIFGVASLGVLAFGIGLGQSLSELSKGWLTVSLTLFVVSLVLLVLIMRDPGRALEGWSRTAGCACEPQAKLDERPSGALPSRSARGAALRKRGPGAPPGIPEHLALVLLGELLHQVRVHVCLLVSLPRLAPRALGGHRR